MCVSIGLTIGKVPLVGVVYNPIMDEVKDCVDPSHCSIVLLTIIHSFLDDMNVTRCFSILTYYLIFKQLFTGVQGKGAFLNGKPIKG